MNETWKELAMTTIAGNELWRIAALFLTLLLGLAAGRLARFLLERSAGVFEKKERGMAAASLRAIGRTTGLIGFVVGLRLGLAFLVLGETVIGIAGTVTSVLITLAVGYTAYCLVDAIEHWLSTLTSRTESKLDDMMVPLVRTSLRVTIVILVLLQIAQLLTDKPLTSIIAGLGVGGLAIALAAQDTVKNFFGSLVIFGDKPFQIGERIVVDNHDGVIEEVGFRSTRLRTLEGHLVTIPNGELANKMIQNIGRRPSIRRLFTVALTYDTPPAKVERALEILKEILKDHEGMREAFPPRVLFKDIGDFSLNLLVIYWYFPADYWKFMAFGERVNLAIIERFNAEGISFAFPTRTVHVVNENQTR